MKSSLSVACLTRGDEGRGAAILRLLRPVADEIVVALDSRAAPEAEAALAGVADALFRYPYAEPVERPRPWLYRQCSGRWLLIVDDDEIPSRALLGALPGLVEATNVTHYWLPRRWLYPSPDRYLDELPWRPDYQLRLVVNDPRLLRFPGELHWSLDAIGPGRFLDAPLYHVDLLVRSPEERRRKAARYEQLQPGKRIAGRPFNDAFYLPEEAGAPRTAVLPPGDGALIYAVLSGAPAAAGPRRAAPTVEATREEIDRDWPAPWLSDSAYAAELELQDELTELAVGEVRTLRLRVRNLGDAIWPWGTQGRPEIRATYRWWRGDEVVTEGLRTPLPADLRPGQACLLPLAVQGPDEPGFYRLAVDLVHEHVRWFESGLVVDPVEVRARPRLAAPGPATPPSGDVVLLVTDPESLRGWAGDWVRSLESHLLDGLPRNRAGAALVFVARGAALLRSAFRVRRGREPAFAGETLRALAGCDQLLLGATGALRRERLAVTLTALCARLLGVAVVAD